MKHAMLAIILIINLLQVDAQASQLNKIVRLDSKDLVQVYFTFDKTPIFNSTSNNRRVDLIFTNAKLSSTASIFPADEAIVKILPHQEKTDLIITLIFRYKPQNVKLTKTADGKIVFETLLGNEYSKTYQVLAERLKGVSELSTVSNDFTNPSIQSPYKKDWMSFFSSYESSLEINVPIKLTLPPFPIIRFLPPGEEMNLQFLPSNFLQLAEKGAWAQLEEEIVEKLQQTTDLETEKVLSLTLGEILLHRGNFDAAYRQLYLLKEQYPKELLGTYANFLFILLRANYQDPNIAEYELQTLVSTLGSNNLLWPYLFLTQIEAALASAKYTRLHKLLLQDNIALPDNLLETIQIHLADYWHAIKKPIKAIAAYQLHTDSPILRTIPYSLNGFCTSLYQQKRYRDAALCYEQLGSIVSEKPLAGLISYRKNMAKMKYQEGSSLLNEFGQIENSYQGTEAGFRAAMKKNDLLYQNNKSLVKQVLEKYKEIADQCTDRTIREEAFFKQALIHWQLDETEKSVELLQQFLRDFLTGYVRISAQALLIDILPGEIKRLVDRQEYMQALVLAKKNKDLFLSNWIDGKFLADIAEAYQRVGLYDESQKLYLYLIEIMPVDQREQFFLPMIQSTFNHGNYSLVEDYSAQYFYNYPTGENVGEILAIRLQSLIADERLEEALKLLPAPLPENKVLYSIAGTLYFRTDDYEKCLMILKKLALIETSLPTKEQFMMAECLFQTGVLVEAESIFQTITEDHPFYEQSLFRLADLQRKKGNEQMALSLFRKIVETGKSPQWKELAKRELQFAALTIRR
ncbi:MAG: tetratricopeptide repeat protein [Proteobacteria bacterium]|nr:tetratricopeptide repeat protein [Pseudomonadota bacterium]